MHVTCIYTPMFSTVNYSVPVDFHGQTVFAWLSLVGLGVVISPEVGYWCCINSSGCRGLTTGKGSIVCEGCGGGVVLNISSSIHSSMRHALFTVTSCEACVFNLLPRKFCTSRTCSICKTCVYYIIISSICTYVQYWMHCEWVAIILLCEWWNCEGILQRWCPDL